MHQHDVTRLDGWSGLRRCRKCPERRRERGDGERKNESGYFNRTNSITNFSAKRCASQMSSAKSVLTLQNITAL
jgi:hypothetical protein